MSTYPIPYFIIIIIIFFSSLSLCQKKAQKNIEVDSGKLNSLHLLCALYVVKRVFFFFCSSREHGIMVYSALVRFIFFNENFNLLVTLSGQLKLDLSTLNDFLPGSSMQFCCCFIVAICLLP